MEKFRSIQLDLLSELDSLCRKENISYILTGYTARAAVRNHTLPQTALVPTIGMRYEDAVHLSKLVQSQNRHVEDAISARKISRLVMRYSHSGTTCIRVDEWNSFRYPGICVEIELMRPVPCKGVFNKMIKVLEATVSLSAKFRGLSPFWRSVLAVVIPFEKAMLRMAYSGRYFKNQHRLRIARFPQKSVEIPTMLVDERQEVEVSGRRLFVSRDVERYLAIEFEQTRPQDDPERSLNDLALTVIDPQVPCEQSLELVRELYGKGPNVNWVHQFILRGRMRFLRKKIHKHWDLLFYTRDRFDLWRQIMPQKERICQLYRAGDIQALREGLAPYLIALERNASKGLTLCFDKELLDIALFLLEKDGRGAYARQLRNQVFPEHLRPLKIEEDEYD